LSIPGGFYFNNLAPGKDLPQTEQKRPPNLIVDSKSARFHGKAMMARMMKCTHFCFKFFFFGDKNVKQFKPKENEKITIYFLFITTCGKHI